MRISTLHLVLLTASSLSFAQAPTQTTQAALPAAKPAQPNTPLTIKAQATSGVAPRWVMLAPVTGVQRVLERAGWSKDQVDLYELNEAFSVQALGVTRELGIGLENVNVNGGAVAIGHPIGASGARVLVTLIHEMMRRDAKKGIAALCLGGGNSVALAVERE